MKYILYCIGSLTFIAAVSIVAILIWSSPFTLGSDKLIVARFPTSDQWPFKDGYSTEYRDLYYRVIGFQDKMTWIVVGGNEEKLVVLKDILINGYDDIITMSVNGLDIADGNDEYNVPGMWDVKGIRNMQVWKSPKKNFYLGIHGGKLYYHSWQQ